ncbi:hypothetical protein SDC9_148131 [bioreactor metagenome]|uniref:Uncharacterized protein n=1 Tax=bioreactor metagenome TaxID=1076179 RepID=A0A645EK50_9ZZZZ
MHFVFWVLWLVICAGGFLKLHEINPALSGWKLGLFYGAPCAMLLLLIYDALRLWFADEKRRMLWLSMLIRFFSVVMLLAVAALLLGPALYRIYYEGNY